MPKHDKTSMPPAPVREKRRWWITDYVNAFAVAVGCAECHWNDNPVDLDFDHLVPDKKENVRKLLGHNWETILNEMRKCEVVCAIHHRRRTKWRNPSRRGLGDPQRRTSFMFGQEEYARHEQRLLRDYHEDSGSKHARQWREQEARRVLERDKVLTVPEWKAVLELQWQEGREPTVTSSHYLDPRWITSDFA
jgi:hypothetical protein